MAISNNPEFSSPGSTGQIPYQSSYQWNLCQGKDSCPEGEYKVYVQFFAPWGRSSGIVSDSIIYQKEIPKKEEKPEEEKILEEVPEEKPTITTKFVRDLFLGLRGEDVRELQRFLNSQGFVLAKTGPGSPGNETTYFGPLTYNAVIRFQEKYALEVLAPWGLTKGTGYVGKTTRAKINKILGY